MFPTGGRKLKFKPLRFYRSKRVYSWFYHCIEQESVSDKELSLSSTFASAPSLVMQTLDLRVACCSASQPWYLCLVFIGSNVPSPAIVRRARPEQDSVWTVKRTCLFPGIGVGSGETEVKCSAYSRCLHQPLWYRTAPCWLPECTEEH